MLVLLLRFYSDDRNVGKTVVSTAGKGVTKVASTGVKGVTTVAQTAQKGVTTVAQTAQKGVTTVATTAASGVTTVATTAASGVTAGASIAANTAKTGASMAAGAATGAVGEVGKSISRATTGNSVEKRHVSRNANEMDIFCSDLYTVEYVMEEMEKVKKTTDITTITFEDCATRGDQNIFKAAINLITETAVRLDNAEGGPKKANKFERVWEAITFLECISSAEDYAIYTSEKKQFQALLRRMLKMKGISSMPIKFQVKIEIHSFMNMEEAMALLDVIGKDETILAVKFPHLSKEKKKIPGQVVGHFDPTTLEFKETASPILINIQYGGKKPTEQGKSAIRIIKVCSQRLRKVAEQLSSGDLPPLGAADESSSNTSYSEVGSSFRITASVR